MNKITSFLAALGIAAFTTLGTANAGYVHNDPINNIDPTGEECVNSGTGSTTCKTADYDVTFPTPEGFPGTNPDGENYHYYNTPGQSPRGEEYTRNWVRNNPTPGNPNPATPEGTRNDATPGGGIPFRNDSPVNSYTTTNNVTGNEVVVNVTLSGHPLFPGVVIRDVSGVTDNSSVINNFGEGNGVLQSPTHPLGGARGAINGVWTGQVPLSQAEVNRRIDRGRRMHEACMRSPGRC